MKKENHLGPYNILRMEARKFIYAAKNRETRIMFEDLNKDSSYSMTEIYHRMMAADDLGFEVLLIPSDVYGKMKIIYRKKFPEIPYSFKY